MGLLNEFINYLKETNNPSKSTLKNYKADIRKFIDWFKTKFGKDFEPTDVTLETISLFGAEKTDINIPSSSSVRSLNRYLSSLRSFFTFLKLEGYVSASPFEAMKIANENVKTDPYRLKDFKNHLYVYNSSALTIKNYIIDVRQFLQWAEEVTTSNMAWVVEDKNTLSKINRALIEEYRQRLIRNFSPATVNRKLSSLRRYLAWASEERLLGKNLDFGILNIAKEVKDEEKIPDIEALRLFAQSQKTPEQTKNLRSWSKFPPFRLVQKVSKTIDYAFESTLISPLTGATKKTYHLFWKMRGKPVFKNLKTEDTRKIQSPIHNIRKISYAPLYVSTKYFPWHKKVYHHIRYTRPNWYKRYHSYSITNYFHLAILMIIMATLGFAFYTKFILKPSGKPILAVTGSPTQPLKIFSFQGRITDINDNPITTANTKLRFSIYDSPTATDPAHRLWEERDQVTPDVDGIFAILLGSDGSGGNAALCNGGNPVTSPATGACGIPQAIIATSSALYLGVTVGNTPELTPRQQLATVAYATNAELLQGMAPITQVGAGTSNVVLALDSSGNLTIGGSAAPVFQASGGQFTISGQTLMLNTVVGTNSNIVLSPDGSGFIDLQKPLKNTTNSNNISTAVGSVEVDDLFSVLATSSGQSAVTINQTGGGPLISASASGTTKFAVDNSGNITSGDLLSLATNTYDIGSASNYWDNLYVNSIYTGGALIANYWQRNSNSLAPINIADALNVGSITSTSAYFHAPGTNNQDAWFNLGTGNVGIGTTEPGAKLHVLGSNTSALRIEGLASNELADIYVNSGGQLVFSTTAGSDDYGHLDFRSEDDEYGYVFRESDGTGTTALLNMYVVDPASGSDYVNMVMNATQATTGLVIQDGGNVGIGTTTPLSTFDVRGNLGTGPVASVSGNTSFATLIVDNDSLTGDLITASSAATPSFGRTQFRLTGDGKLYARSYYDLDNSAYFLDPAATGTSLTTVGSIGINTTTPSEKLDVNGNATVSGNLVLASAVGTSRNLQATANNTLNIGGNTTGNISIVANDTDAGVIQLGTGGAGSTTVDLLGFPVKSDTGDPALGFEGATYYNTFDNKFRCYVNAAWADCGGGGTQYWQEILGALSPSNITDDLLLGSTATTSALFSVTGIASNQPVASVSGNLIVMPRNGWGGNVGIGTTSPSYLVHVSTNQNSSQGELIENLSAGAGAYSALRLGNNTDQNAAIFRTSSANTAYAGANSLNLWTQGAHPIGFSTTNLLRMIIDSAGNVGIGTTGPDQLLDVLGRGGATQLRLTSTDGSVYTDIKTDQLGYLSLSPSGLIATLAGTFNPNADSTYDLGSPSRYWANLYVDTIYSGGSTIANYWQRNLGALSPINITDDLLLGGTATSTAKFSVLNMIGLGTPTASVSATTTGNGVSIGGGGTIQSLRANTLVIGGDTTGFVTIQPNKETDDYFRFSSNGTDLTLESMGGSVLSLDSGSGVLTLGAGTNTIANTSPDTDLLINPNGTGDVQFHSASYYVNDSGQITVATNESINGIDINAGAVSDVTTLGMSGVLTNSSATTNAIALTGNGAGITFSGTGPNQIITAAGVDLALMPGTTGNVGIGTVTTAGKLDIHEGTDRNLVVTVNGGTNVLQIWAANDARDNIVPLEIASDGLLIPYGNVGIGNVSPLTALDVTGSASLSANLSLRGAATAHTFNILDNGTLNIQRSPGGDAGLATALFIQNNGNMGIRTTDPGTSLEVRGNNVTNKGQVYLNANSGQDGYLGINADANKEAGMFFGSAGSPTMWLYRPLNTNDLRIYDDTTANADFVTFEEGGSVGIGTTNPSSPLHVYKSDGNITSKFESGGADNWNQFISTSGTGEYGIWNDALYFQALDSAANGIRFYGSSEATADLQILASGSVGIGTTSPSEKLDINGNATASGNLVLATGDTTIRTIQTTRNNTLTIGGDTTGNLKLVANDTAGGVIQLGTGGAGSTTPDLLGLDVKSDTGDPTLGFEGAMYYNTFDNKFRCYVNAAWADCGGSTTQYWQRNLGALAPTNITDDLLIGAASTASANFRVAALTGQAYARSFVDLDNSTYLLDPAATGTSLATVGSIGIGTATPLTATGLHVNKATSANSMLVLNQLDTVGTIGDFIAASASGVTQFRVDSTGDVIVGSNGNGKLTALTIDPLYTIDGVRYSTYGTSMVGVKEEVAGKADLIYDPLKQAYAYKIELNNQPQGSDLWLFSRVSDPDVGLTTVLLTPNSSASVWYAKDVANRTITLFSNTQTAVSYRLTAPRFDYLSWGNMSDETDPTLTGALAPGMAELLQRQLEASLSAQVSTQSTVFSINQSFDEFGNVIYLLVDSFGNSIRRTGNFSDLIIANIEAGFANISALTVSSINLTSDNLIIGGQTLRSYIASVVEDLGYVKSPIISPLAEIDQISTNLITPLGENKNIAIAIKDSSLEIRNGATGSAVATIDNQGNASFSGTVNSNDLAVNNNATIGGTLRAGRIIADQIEGLNIQTSTISANYITNNFYNSTSSAESNSPNLNWENSSGNNYISISSFSGQFAYVENFSSDFMKVNQGLMVFGPASLNDVSITGQLAIGGQMILVDNGINVLGADLELQPLRQGGISFLSGLFRIDANGNIVANGDAQFAKNVTVRGRFATGLISPLADSNLNIALSQKSDQTDSSLNIQNSSGSAVLSINNIGDLISSGSGTFQKLNIGFVTPAYALSNTEVIATGSAGIASVKPHQSELTIINSLVTEKSLIYITPRGDSSLFLLRQVPGVSFTVGISKQSNTEMPFNWIIIN